MNAPGFITNPVVQVDDRFAAVSVPSGGTDTAVVSIKTRVGVRPFVVFLGTNTQGSAADFVWNLKADGAKMFPYADFSVQVAEISRPTDYLPYPVEVGQNTTIEITARNNSGAAVVCSGRLMIFYSDL